MVPGAWALCQLTGLKQNPLHQMWSRVKMMFGQSVDLWCDRWYDPLVFRGEQDAQCADHLQSERCCDSSCGPVIQNDQTCLLLKREGDGLALARSQRSVKDSGGQRLSQRTTDDLCGKGNC